MGSRRAACLAGYQPKKMPTAAATPTDRITAAGEMEVDQRRWRERPCAAARPTITPMMPPVTLKATASRTNCERRSRARAPTARRMPISRVRSVTDNSMMFMIPIPPTSSDTAAMPASSAVIVRVARSSGFPSCSSVTFSNPETLTLEQLGKTLDRATRTMTALLAGIAAVSLLVGGIGIMNIMLLSVTERTREIGVRRAVGARARDVRSQFVLEAVALSVTGGIIGVIVGLAAAQGLSHYLHWSTTISPAAVILSVGVAAAVGIFFGWYPAKQAARLDPIQSLRYE